MFMSMSKWDLRRSTLGTTGAIFSHSGGLMIYLCTISHRFLFCTFSCMMLGGGGGDGVVWWAVAEKIPASQASIRLQFHDLKMMSLVLMYSEINTEVLPPQ
jgi:hypothetical protein